MTLTIGRCSGLRPDRTSPTRSGNHLSFAGMIDAASSDELAARRQQLLGIVDNRDEPVIPVVWASDSKVDGFYRPIDAQVGPFGASSGKRGTFSVELERLTGYAAAEIEMTIASVVRTNAHGIVAPVGVVRSIPFSQPGWGLDDPVIHTVLLRPTELMAAHQIGTDTAPVTLRSWRAFGPPGDYYKIGCAVEVLCGSTWYPLVGRDIPADARWRISNGIVRLTAGADISTSGTFEVWDSVAGAWESRQVSHYTTIGVITQIGQGVGTGAKSTAILRNSHEQVTVRTSTYQNAYTYTLQRGAHLVSVDTFNSDGSTQRGVGFNTAHFAAATAITGGIRATSNDANGNRMVFGMAQAFTSDLVNGAVYATAGTATTNSFIGVELNGSSAIAGNTAAAVAQQYFGAPSWSQRVIVK